MLGDASARVILNIVGFLWPAYSCYKALDHKKLEVLRQWCIYWLVLAIFTASERLVLDNLLFWLPLYYEGKVLFVVYLWHPQTQGALYLYARIVQPLMAEYEAVIDQKLGECRDFLSDFSSKHFRSAKDYVQQKAGLALEHMQQLQQQSLQSGGHSSGAASSLAAKSR